MGRDGTVFVADKDRNGIWEFAGGLAGTEGVNLWEVVQVLHDNLVAVR